MNHILQKSIVSLQRGVWVSAQRTLPKEYAVVLKTCIPSISRISALGSRMAIRDRPLTSSPLMFGPGNDELLYVRGESYPGVMRTLGVASLCIRNFHTTFPCRGAVPKLQEAPVDSSDNIDPSKPADYDPSKHDAEESRSAPSAKILQLVNEIAYLSLIDASDLSYLLKKKLGLPDSAMPYYGGGMGGNMGSVAAGGASPSAEEEKKPEKTNFDIKLEKYDAASKIKVIKEVRTFTSLGLKEAKELVEKLPAILKQGVGKEEAEQVVAKLKSVGATAVLE